MSQAQTHFEDLHSWTTLLDLPAKIRFDPVECPPEVIDRTNASGQRTGESAFEPAEVAIDRIRTTQSASESRLKSWAWHPDERVPIALLSSHHARPFIKGSERVLLQIAPRAIQEAQERGEVWTPVLDALSGSI